MQIDPVQLEHELGQLDPPTQIPPDDVYPLAHVVHQFSDEQWIQLVEQLLHKPVDSRKKPSRHSEQDVEVQERQLLGQPDMHLPDENVNSDLHSEHQVADSHLRQPAEQAAHPLPEK